MLANYRLRTATSYFVFRCKSRRGNRNQLYNRKINLFFLRSNFSGRTNRWYLFNSVWMCRFECRMKSSNSSLRHIKSVGHWPIVCRWLKCSTSFSSRMILLEKDSLLFFFVKSVNLPRMLNETFVDSVDSQACMLTFYPKFDMEPSTTDYVDSNSIDGKQVQQAKQLAHLFCTSVKPEVAYVYFDIVAFWSDNDECFQITSPNNKKNLDKAKHFIMHSFDHRGNTDLFTVLRRYSLLPLLSKPGWQFILLSDGHINDLPSIFSLLSHQLSTRQDRFFTFSTGDASNKHQLKHLANQAPTGDLAVIFDSNYRSR